MALSRIWAAFILVSIVVAAVRYVCVPADKEIFSQMVTGKAGDTVRAAPELRVQKADGIIGTCSYAVVLAIGLIGIMALFMGLVSIAEAAGGMRFLARITGPFFSKLFPDVPPGHPAMGHMVMNFSANLLGLDNAATPFALKAMESLQEINPDKTKASNPQIMFLCLHQSGLQLIPVSVIALLAANGAKEPTDVFIPIVIATFLTTLASMSVVAFRQKINLFQPAILVWIGSLSVLIAALVIYLRTLSVDGVQAFSRAFSSGLILFIFLVIVAVALYRKVNIFDAFVQGARGGFETAVRIIPYLVGILVAISLLRTSGTFDAILDGLKYLFHATGADTRFVDGLPTALIKPLSSAGARGMLVDTMKTTGNGSFATHLSAILQGSSESTFYVAAVYYGSVAIRNMRYSIGAMLLADLVSILSSIFLCYLFFGHLH
ncbi:MAG TPA: nucleoside recognition domain-containing protein [Puia sp.]|nr:nucleoside recognition domain-containing protein [Puia sp.]